jgi:hypothetical protein
MRNVVLVLTLVVSASNAQGQAAVPAAPAQIVPSPAAIRVAFKLDPRLTTGLYMGERWVSPPTYSASQLGSIVTIEARASGVDARRRPVKINAKWIAADPDMVTVTPGEGSQVRIAVRRAGESLLRVTADDLTRQLAVKAVQQDQVLRVEITQK